MAGNLCHLPNLNTYLLIALIAMGVAMLITLAWVINKISKAPNKTLVDELRKLREQGEIKGGYNPAPKQPGTIGGRRMTLGRQRHG